MTMNTPMSKDAQAIDKQATVCVRMDMGMDAVHAVAKARKWYGANKRRLVNKVNALRHRNTKAL